MMKGLLFVALVTLGFLSLFAEGEEEEREAREHRNCGIHSRF